MNFQCKFLILVTFVGILVVIVHWCLEDPTLAKKTIALIAEKGRKMLATTTAAPITDVPLPQKAPVVVAKRSLDIKDPDEPIMLEQFGDFLNSFTKKYKILAEMN